MEDQKILSKNKPVSQKARSDKRRPQAEPDFDQTQLVLFPQHDLLNELAEAASSNAAPEAVIRNVLQKLAHIYSTDRAAVFLLSADGKSLRGYGELSGGNPLVLAVENSLAGFVLQQGNLKRYQNRDEFPGSYDDVVGVNSVIVAPIKTRKEVMGVLVVQSKKKDHFQLIDEKLMMVLAGQIASLLLDREVNRDSHIYSKNLELIHRVVQRIVGLTDILEITQLTAELMAEYFNYEFVIILGPDPFRKMMINLGIGGTLANMIPLGYSYPIGEGIIGRVFQTGKTYLSNDVIDDSFYLPIPEWHAGSELCIPLREADKIIGVLNFERSVKGGFTEIDQILGESLAGILSTVMMNATRYQQLAENLRQIDAVRETGLDLVENLDREVLLKRVVHRTCELIDARGAEIGLVEESSQGIRVQTSENPWYDFTGHLIPIGKGIAGQILMTGKPVNISNYNSWPERLMLGKPADFKTAAGVPLKLKSKVIGTLVIMDDRPGRVFTNDDIKTLELISRNIALAVHNAELFEEIKEAIEAQRQAESRLIQSERMAAAGRLTASIAHEINNPLQALYNCLHLAERCELSSDDRHKYLTMARSELDRLITIVQRMLDFYRPGVRDRQQTDINALINRTVRLVEPQLTQKNIQIYMDLLKDLPAVVVVQSQIQQVLFNLIINAMEAMPKGGKIFIETNVTDSLLSEYRKNRRAKGSSFIEIIMRDTGPGVPEEERERIFEPFVSTKDEGTGLGLSVSYGIIQAHGGTLSLISDGQGGACFRIALPEEK